MRPVSTLEGGGADWEHITSRTVFSSVLRSVRLVLNVLRQYSMIDDSTQ
jgi:hypothetical protein